MLGGTLRCCGLDVPRSFSYLPPELWQCRPFGFGPDAQEQRWSLVCALVPAMGLLYIIVSVVDSFFRLVAAFWEHN